MVLMKEEFHDLKAGDQFALTRGGTIYTVGEGYHIDDGGSRLIMYRTENGLHGHLADHTEVWLVL